MRVPASAGPGSVMTVRTPTGETVRVTVPQGVYAGSTFEFEYGGNTTPPPRPPRPASPHAPAAAAGGGGRRRRRARSACPGAAQFRPGCLADRERPRPWSPPRDRTLSAGGPAYSPIPGVHQPILF